jgi:hypothetical protein
MEMRKKNQKLIEIEHKMLLPREVRDSQIKALEGLKQGFLMEGAKDRQDFNPASQLKLE